MVVEWICRASMAKDSLRSKFHQLVSKKLESGGTTSPFRFDEFNADTVKVRSGKEHEIWSESWRLIRCSFFSFFLFVVLLWLSQLFDRDVPLETRLRTLQDATPIVQEQKISDVRILYLRCSWTASQQSHLPLLFSLCPPPPPSPPSLSLSLSLSLHVYNRAEFC